MNVRLADLARPAVGRRARPRDLVAPDARARIRHRCAPIGRAAEGEVLELDLKESAQLGMGPHGICIGATGSGKSELLRTLITALALPHPPEDLSMVLVDYKGGAAFAPFAGLPHVAGIIDNLADDPQLTERARASIHGEVVRRQELLQRRRIVAVISHYRELRREQARTCRRCRTCSSSSTSSASCSPPSRTSSTCCSPSAGSAAPSACTCCCPASGSRPAGCAAWTPT